MQLSPDSLSPDRGRERILVIKHSALGDIVLASGAMKAIRAHHHEAHLSVLTTRGYAPLLEASGWFDAVLTDTRPKFYRLREMAALRRMLRAHPYTRVYDLQVSTRSTSYFRLMPSPKPEWSGIARGASHRHATPWRETLHTVDRHAEQLRLAGVEATCTPDISWLRGDWVVAASVPAPYGLLVPGGSAHRPEKRYPQEGYIALARQMLSDGLTPVLLGGEAEAPLLQAIATAVPEAVNLCHRTSIGDLADLARGAARAIGNDTGPMHVIAAAGCASTVLFSAASNPAMCAPRGDHVRLFQRDPLTLATLSPDEVYGS